MKICVSGATSTGKTTYVTDFLKQWTNYKLGELTYRSILKEKNLNHSTKGNEETQVIIRDSIIDDICKYNKTENVIFDRGLMDNLAYTLYLNSKGLASDEFTKQNVNIIREAISFYDIILYVPVLEAYPVKLESNGVRDDDPDFRSDTDLIMKLIQQDYLKEPGVPRMFFPNYSCPALLEIYGNPRERIELTKLYINKDGSVYGEDDNILVKPYKSF